MRLTQKKIEEIIVSILGEEGLSLLKHLHGKENVSEFVLASKTRKDIKVIRRMLYFLYNHNLVGFTRKKDKQKGWYVYYWTLLPESIKFDYYKRKKELLDKLKHRLEEENKELFFTCPNNCVRLNFDQAMDFEFHCPECGELISQDNSEERVTALKKEISKVEEELKKLVKTKTRKKVAKKTTKKKTVKKRKVVKKKLVKKKVVKKKKTVKKKAKKSKKVKRK